MASLSAREVNGERSGGRTTSVSVDDSETWVESKRYTVYKVVVRKADRAYFVFRRSARLGVGRAGQGWAELGSWPGERGGRKLRTILAGRTASLKLGHSFSSLPHLLPLRPTFPLPLSPSGITNFTTSMKSSRSGSLTQGSSCQGSGSSVTTLTPSSSSSEGRGCTISSAD